MLLSGSRNSKNREENSNRRGITVIEAGVFKQEITIV